MSFRQKSTEKEERRKSQRVISRELKIDVQHNSKTKLRELYLLLTQCKWVRNDMIRNQQDILNYKYNEPINV